MLTILGLMSGSSLDGMDVALCRFGHDTFELVHTSLIEYPRELIAELVKAPKYKVDQLCALEVKYARFLADNLKLSVPKELMEQVDFVSIHGHTLVHSPEKHYSYQLGRGSYLSPLLSLPVISDFRVQDMMKEGQGAPIAPIVEKLLFPNGKVFLNLGGISNIAVHDNENIVAYDIGACNQLLNRLARIVGKPFDDKGEIARSGQLNQALFDKSMHHQYHLRKYPKSLDNTYVFHEFVKPYISYNEEPVHLLRTAVEYIARSIALELHRLRLTGETIIISGGGANNTFLVERLQDMVAPMQLTIEKPTDILIEYKEAILMAYMGYLRVIQHANINSIATGAQSDTSAGGIYWG